MDIHATGHISKSRNGITAPIEARAVVGVKRHGFPGRPTQRLDDSSLDLISDAVYRGRLSGIDGSFDPADGDASRLSFQFDLHHDRAVSSDIFVPGKAHAAAMAAVS